MDTTHLPAPSVSPAPDTSDLRVVLFLTALSDDSIPGTDHPLASLLPLGYGAFVEHVVQACAIAGLRDIDLVASDHPELLRSFLGDGARWGLRLRWHLVRDGAAPYGFLRQGLGAGPTRLLIGHGHQWLDARAITALLREDGVAVRLDQATAWTGWCSLVSQALASLPAHADAPALNEWMLQRAVRCGQLVQPAQFAEPGNAVNLLAQQARILDDAAMAQGPATWVRKPWGLMSPEAHVHPEAIVQGPVLVGPGCVVNRGAVLGPDAVLCHDVMLASGAVVQGSLVLANTYVSGDLTLIHAVAQGACVQHTDWNVRNTLPSRDALLLPLQNAPVRPGMSWPRAAASRGAAAGLSLLLLPLWPLLALGAWVRGQPVGWRHQRSVIGFDRRQQLRSVELRSATGQGWCAAAMGFLAALLDVAQGRRRWFGVRPRDHSQWYALRRDWQRLLSGSPVGIFHAPAWLEDANEDSEMEAVADAYFAVAGGWRERLRILLAAVVRPRSIPKP